ncbi:MAG: hypothetical protein CYG60_02550 [Actinobacteria bacterium]|nr:MAG: hypothetical protein CYG60_02550 [Actinomycetota bacterium]
MVEDVDYANPEEREMALSFLEGMFVDALYTESPPETPEGFVSFHRDPDSHSLGEMPDDLAIEPMPEDFAQELLKRCEEARFRVAADDRSYRFWRPLAGRQREYEERCRKTKEAIGRVRARGWEGFGEVMRSVEERAEWERRLREGS